MPIRRGSIADRALALVRFRGERRGLGDVRPTIADARFRGITSTEIVGVVERLTGAPAEAVPFGTEAPFLAQLTPEVVVLSPGDIAVAHQPGERLALTRIEPCARILRELIAERCGRH